MATAHAGLPYLSHEERTSTAPRRNDVHEVTVHGIEQVNRSVRLLRLRPDEQRHGVELTAPEFQAGQWLDVHVPDPGIGRPGGFTITSTPEEGRRHRSRDGAVVDASIELAVQYSAKNPPAAWLWRPAHEILGRRLLIRVGGSFVWPPPGIALAQRQRVVLIAGGVGLNPLISILSHLQRSHTPMKSVKLIYATKSETTDGSDILFLSRIRRLLEEEQTPFESMDVELFVGASDGNLPSVALKPQPGLSHHNRRMMVEDLERALGPVHQRPETVCYICGPRAMTDSFVSTVTGLEGVKAEHVLSEKWW